MALLPCDRCGGYTGMHGSWDTIVYVLCNKCADEFEKHIKDEIAKEDIV